MMILDASALLAYLQHEPGGLLVEEILPTAIISTVNWCEVAQKLRVRSIDHKSVCKRLEILGLKFQGNRTRFLTNDKIYAVTMFKAVRTFLR